VSNLVVVEDGRVEVWMQTPEKYATLCELGQKELGGQMLGQASQEGDRGPAQVHCEHINRN
jgi:hypothetical protein